MLSLYDLRPTSRRCLRDNHWYWDEWAPELIMSVPRMMDQVAREVFGDGCSDSKSSEQDKLTNFEMKLAMRNFKPEDIKIKVDGSNLIVEAKHEEKKEGEGAYSHSFREVRRTFPIPDNVDKEKLSSAFTRNGILEIEAPLLLPAVEESKPEKTAIEITHMEQE